MMRSSSEGDSSGSNASAAKARGLETQAARPRFLSIGGDKEDAGRIPTKPPFHIRAGQPGRRPRPRAVGVGDVGDAETARNIRRSMPGTSHCLRDVFPFELGANVGFLPQRGLGSCRVNSGAWSA